MKADGRVVKTELNVVKRFGTNFRRKWRIEALQLLKGILKEKIEIEPVAAQIGANLNYSSKWSWHMFVHIAFADGQATVSELTLIKRIAQLIGISNSDFQAIWAMFNKQEDKNWAYKVLEIEPNASNEEVKKPTAEWL